MTRNEKKTAIENMAERFMSISDLEGKSISERLIKCSLYPTPQGENHSGYRVG